jgi:hypothetical protein
MHCDKPDFASLARTTSLAILAAKIGQLAYQVFRYSRSKQTWIQGQRRACKKCLDQIDDKDMVLRAQHLDMSSLVHVGSRQATEDSAFETSKNGLSD